MSKMTLAELDALESQPNKEPAPAPEPPKPDIQPGTGEPAPPNLEEEARKQKLADEEKARLEEEAKKEATTPEPDGGTATEPTEEDTKIFEEVDKIWGEALEVDYGTVDPLTPEGIHLREQAIADRAVTQFEAYLEQTDPRGYQYILHRRNGGTDEEFFGQKTTTLPDYDTFKDSVDLQVRVYRDNLIAKGIDPEEAKFLADQAVKDKKIFDKADKAYKDVDQAQKESIKAAQLQLEQQDKERAAQVENLRKALTEGLSSPSTQIIIPDAKKVAFQKYLESHVRYDEDAGQFMFAQPITREKLNRQIESMWLQFVDGKLEDVVRRQAGTQQAKRLKAAVNKSAQGVKGEGDPKPSGKKTLGDI